MTNLFNYIDRPSPIHSLTGATKFICLMLWSFAAMSTYDTRMLIAMTVGSIILFAVGRIHFKDVSFMFGFMVIFLVLNSICIYLFSPRHGTQIYGTCTLLFGMSGKYAVLLANQSAIMMRPVKSTCIGWLIRGSSSTVSYPASVRAEDNHSRYRDSHIGLDSSFT